MSLIEQVRHNTKRLIAWLMLNALSVVLVAIGGWTANDLGWAVMLLVLSSAVVFVCWDKPSLEHVHTK